MKKIKLLSLAAAMTLGLASLNSCTEDKCKDVTCENGGACLEGVCDCEDGYEGTNCQTETRTKFLDDYNVQSDYTVVSSGATGTDNYSSTISAASDISDVRISNFSNSGQFITATLDGSTGLIISNQSVTVNGTVYTATGTGSINGSTVTLNYSLSSGGVVLLEVDDTYTK